MDKPDDREGLAEKGFLSAEIEIFRDVQRDKYQKSFFDAETASDSAYQIMMAAGADLSQPHMIASLTFLQRTVRSCQAAIILCERGLVVDAQTLTRSAVEALFYAGALINDPSVFCRIAREGDIAEAKQAKAMIRSLSGKGLTEQNIADLNEVSRRADGGGAGFSCFDAAGVADLIPLYDTIYRGLSGVASHATFRSMDSSILMRDDVPALITGPTDYHLEFTLGLIKVCLDVSSIKLRENFIFDE